ncbi:MAG: T9SS type A sorting domain-containing protein [Leadbetterella sp.]|nr:T9SS type A sorting domain-containing protein [Leadbetterella sp.]
MKYFSIALIIVFLSFTNRTTAQLINSELPKFCTSPPEGYAIGGNINLNPPLACIQKSNGDALNVRIRNVKDFNLNAVLEKPMFFVDASESFVVLSLNGVVPNNNEATINLSVGKHLIVLKGELNGQKYLTCKIQENILSETPVIIKDTCYLNKMSFEISKNPANVHDFYYINWGNGDIDTLNMKNYSLPVILEKTYTGAVSTVLIDGSFRRNNLNVCPTRSVALNLLIPNSYPSLSYLEPVENEKSISLKYKSFFPEEVSVVLGTSETDMNAGNWSKIGEGTNGIAVLKDFDFNKDYCFRVKSKDKCSNPVNSLNTLCTITLKVKPLSINEMEVTWNVPKLQKYITPKVILERAEEDCAFCKTDSIRIFNSELNTYVDKNLDWRKKYIYKLNYMEYDTVISQTRRFRGVESFKVKQDFKSQITGNEISEKKEFEVYPNPSSGRVTLKLNFLQTTKPIIEIFDISGKTNKINNFSIVQDGLGTAIDFDLKDLALKPGLYFIKASSEKWHNTYKFLVE